MSRRRSRPFFHDVTPTTPTDHSAAERALLRRSFLGFVDALSPFVLSAASWSLLEFARDAAGALGLDLAGRDLSMLDLDYGERRGVTALPVLLDVVAELRALPQRGRASALDRRIGWVADTLRLDAIETALVGILARYALFEVWQKLIRALPGGGMPRPSKLAMLTGHRAAAVDARLAHGARLVATGLVRRDNDGDISPGGFLERLAAMQVSTPAALARRMLPPAPPSTLAWDDFAHLGGLPQLAADAISRAARGNAGVNVLFHGLAGTGKSELARAIADRTGLIAVFAGLADEDGDEPSRHERLAHLNILRALTRGSRRHIIVVDEADDVLNLLAAEGRDQRSKLWLNRMVEEVHAPTIWITNDPDRLGDTLVRRMHLAVGFDLPPASVRARMVARAAAKAGVSLDNAALDRIAQLPAAPAVLTNAVATARLTGQGAEAIAEAGRSILDALGAPVRPVLPLPAAYDPGFAQADQDLGALATRLAAAPERGWSLLLAGAPGTGKSAWARHLAARLGIEVEERRGADLLSPFVGGTEANIARAFRTSADRGAMLLIDEADTFLFDRRGATRSWEGSMVNEMLRWMEHHPAPFVATTNLADTLDPATQRRFTLTVRFRALTPARAAALFAATFGAALPAGAPPLEGVTPGDIGVVAKRARLLGERDAGVLAAWVRGEVEARDGRAGRTGFHLPAPAPEPRLARCDVA